MDNLLFFVLQKAKLKYQYMQNPHSHEWKAIHTDNHDILIGTKIENGKTKKEALPESHIFLDAEILKKIDRMSKAKRSISKIKKITQKISNKRFITKRKTRPYKNNYK